ncbi:hypothetical protein F5Y16DRAFT_368104 [Xylariaceae sp. FL0255]|nr:hypothetical protein F5Y16DRAFT_368104 [Xylariaceae sp. FL0255]
MAPRTRGSTGAASAIAAALALDREEEKAALDRQLEQDNVRQSTSINATNQSLRVMPKRGRGRPPQNAVPTPRTGSSDSASSAPTPITITSDDDYSTPATSNAVTPAPMSIKLSTVDSTSASLPRPRRGRLQIELPPVPVDDDDIDDGYNPPKPKPFSTQKGKQRLVVQDSDDDDESDDRDAILARKLQKEEDEKVEPVFEKRGLLAAGRRFPKNSSSPMSVNAVLNSPEDSDDDMPLRKRIKTRPGPIGNSKARRLLADDSEDADSVMDSPFATSANTSDQDVDGSELAGFSSDDDEGEGQSRLSNRFRTRRSSWGQQRRADKAKRERALLEKHHPELITMWTDLEKMPPMKAGRAPQPTNISLQMKPFQLEGLAWMKAMETTEFKGGLLGDEMGLGKTIQAVSLIMSDYPAKSPTLVLLPPVALGQWQDEIASYTNNQLKTIVFHGTNSKAKKLSIKELKKLDVIIMSYNSLESMFRRQEKGIKKKDVLYKERSLIHQIKFHRVILDEAHCIKTRSTMTARACFALDAEYRWCLSGTPLQNRIGELFSLVRFLNIQPFASYVCKKCPCSFLEWSHIEDGKCKSCSHASPSHVSLFNNELLNPIQKYGNFGEGKAAFQKLRLLTDRIMLRRLKKNHTNAMELPVKEILIDRQFFGEEENDLAYSIMTNNKRKFNTYVAQGVVLNNYANIFGLIMQMRQIADHPDLILKKSSEGGQNVMVCCICDEAAEEAIQSKCKHDFCRECARSYIASQEEPDCPRCHILLQIDLEQPSIEQDEMLVKKSSIINRIKMENWTSSSKIELLVHQLHKLRSDNASHKSIIFSQFTTMLQLIEWRLRRAGITTVMLDGSMTPAQRQASIKVFMENVDVECFLVSLKAGGVALNLTEASHVFIVDPWWNPAAEWQSADRCHRIGQTRPCTITRLCIEDSVESRMVLLQEKKTNMINSTINSDDAAMESLTLEDLSFLFRGT